VSTDPRDYEALGALLRVVGEALEDETKRKELSANAKSVLEQAGLDLEDDVTVHVHQNSRKELHIVLPSGPLGEELDPNKARAHHLINLWPV
jgi:hypothetical protein